LRRRRMMTLAKNEGISDALWEALFDEDELNRRRGEAEKKYDRLTMSQIQALRKRCKTDLFFLASGPLEYELLSPTFHGHYTKWLRATWDERYRMTLFARDHYKTTIGTVAESVQMALPNDAGVTSHPYALGPNIKLLLAHEKKDTASRFLFEITQAFRYKLLMLALFEDVIPQKNIQRMNKNELELPRTQFHREPTFDTIGVGGAAQGGHYHWLKLDDLVGEDARDSETVMKKVLDWFDNVNSLLTRLKIDGWDLIGTRWSAIDVYSHAVKMYGVNKERSILRAYYPKDVERMEDGQLCVYARGALEQGLPVFPEEFALEDLNRIRRNKKIWASQYANNPREGDMTRLDPAWLKYYNVGRGDRLVVFEGESSRTVRVSELDRLILTDPTVGEASDADEAGFVVTGTDRNMNIYVLEAYKIALKAPDFMDELFRLYMKWNPRLVSIEDVAFSVVFKYWFEEKCKALGIYPSVYQYKTRNKAKVKRIEGLGNYGAAGQIYILEGMHQLRDEWEWFPLGESEHILDAMAQGIELWQPAVGERAREMKEAEQIIEEERCNLTGYSSLY
jgi:hypothetical protein